MVYTTLIVVCSLVVIAYLFEIVSKRVQFPSVVLLLTLGACTHLITDALNINIPNLETLLPIFGTLGLILIVLEGGLELDLRMDRKKLIKQSSLVALLGLVIPIPILMICAMSIFGVEWRTAILNIIPFCVLSSAIAIPSVNNFIAKHKEFVIYETSFSDVLGIVVYNFFELNENYNLDTLSVFIMNFVYISILSISASLLLGYLLQRIQMHVKFVLILSILVLLYSIAKILHLPSLLMVLVFGLFLNNAHLIKEPRFEQIMRPTELSKEVDYFEKIVLELTFLVKTFFFLIFGYLIDINSLLDLYSLQWAVGIMVVILGIRWLVLKFYAKEFSKYVFWLAPRGLISILLFLSIPPAHKIEVFHNGLVVQVILISIFVLMFGVMRYKAPKEDDHPSSENPLNITNPSNDLNNELVQ